MVGGGRPRVTGSDIAGNQGSEIRGARAFEGQYKQFVPDVGVCWNPVDEYEQMTRVSEQQERLMLFTEHHLGVSD